MNYQNPKKTVVNTYNISWLGLLAIVFIVLKLTGHIAWSWFWVLSPIIIPWLIILSILLIAWIMIAIFDR